MNYTTLYVRLRLGSEDSDENKNFTVSAFSAFDVRIGNFILNATKGALKSIKTVVDLQFTSPIDGDYYRSILTALVSDV